MALIAGQAIANANLKLMLLKSTAAFDATHTTVDAVAGAASPNRAHEFFVARDIDCSALPAYLQAVQWDGEQAKGHIEFVQDGSGVFLLNQPILSFAQFDYLVQEHAQLLAAERAAAEQAAAEQAEGGGGET